MLPYVTIGGARISMYWTMFFVGMIGILILTLRRKEKYGFGVVKSVLFTILTVVLGLAGAKLLYILENWQETLEQGVSLSGVSFFGSVYLIPLLMPLFGLLFRLRPKRSLDAVAPAVAVMIGCIRVGCFFNGCCGGVTSPWGFIWPTQAMESVCDFMLLYLLLRMEKTERCVGWLYPTLITVYSAYRFGIEFLRDTPRGLLGLANGHWFAFGGLLLGGLWLLLCKKKNHPRGAARV